MSADRSELRATTTAPPTGFPATPVRRAEPQRMCVGCRRSDSWSVLVRVVAERAQAGSSPVVPDLRHRLPGRGAWLHPDRGCLDSAVRRRAFGRALRVQGELDTAAIAAYLSLHEALHAPPQGKHQSDERPQGGLDADEHPMSTQQ